MWYPLGDAVLELGLRSQGGFEGGCGEQEQILGTQDARGQDAQSNNMGFLVITPIHPHFSLFKRS